jgi:hypothetical protein
MNHSIDMSKRRVLPVPDQPYTGFVAYDANDPDSKIPPI